MSLYTDYFRRRKSKSDVTPTAFRELNFDPILNDSEFVSMLVPNPVEGQEWKTRIGQKDVDEVSGIANVFPFFYRNRYIC